MEWASDILGQSLGAVVATPQPFLNDLFEGIMLACFGAAWPFAVLKTWRSKTSAGKSFVFLGLLATGYVSGLSRKLLYDPDWVIVLYSMNFVLVVTDLMLSIRYRRNLPGLAVEAASDGPRSSSPPTPPPASDTAGGGAP